MKNLFLTSLLLFISSAIFSQSTNNSANSKILIKKDSLSSGLIISPNEEISSDEGTNTPVNFEKTTFDGKDVYIKQEKQITIIYEPN